MLSIKCFLQSFHHPILRGVFNGHLHPGNALQQPRRSTAEMQAAEKSDQELEEAFQILR